MRGFTHFLSGLSIATFFKSLLKDALNGGLWMLVPAAFAYLPDFLDFKIYKHFEKWDYIIKPKYDDMNPQEIAETIAKAIDEAYETGKDVRLKCFTARAPGDVYRKYSVRFRSDKNEIEVVVGPLVTPSGTEVEGTEPPPDKRVGIAKTKHPFSKKYPRPFEVKGFHGPSYQFIREGDVVEVNFLPWHREWAHSFITGIMFGAVLYLMTAFVIRLDFALDLTIASILGFWAHIIEDHMGMMGGNLFWPITRKRTPGFALSESGSMFMNMGTAWFFITLMLYNFNQAATIKYIPLDPMRYYVIVTILPTAILYAIGVIYHREVVLKKWAEAEQREEIEEVSEFREG